jgi:Rieske 2Fe-2S family protein
MNGLDKGTSKGTGSSANRPSAYQSLPARYYTCPEHFRAEMDYFFGSRWVCAGQAESLEKAGDYRLQEIAGENLILTRVPDGQIRAFYNLCRHRGARLCESERGTFKGRIQCPYHAWTYDLNGALVGAPHMADTPGFAVADYPLHAAACAQWNGLLFVNLAKEPAPIDEQLGPLSERLRPWRIHDLKVGRRAVYQVKANWKHIIQNYSECLHCPVIHPALAKISPYMSGENEPAHRSYLGGRMSLKDGVDTMTMSGKTTRAPLPGLGPEQLRYVYYYASLPNLLLSLHPDYVMTHLLLPKSVNETEILCEFLFHPDQLARPDFTADDAYEFWDLTNRQDWHASELSQQGMMSRAYTPGPYSVREALLHGFDELILERFPLDP